MWGDSSLWFWFALPWWPAMLSIFFCVCWPSPFHLWKNVFSILLPIFFFNFIYDELCKLCISVGGINTLSVISHVNIVSHSVGCLFVFLMVTFAVQKLLSLISSHLFISLHFLYFGNIVWSWVEVGNIVKMSSVILNMWGYFNGVFLVGFYRIILEM